MFYVNGKCYEEKHVSLWHTIEITHLYVLILFEESLSFSTLGGLTSCLPGPATGQLALSGDGLDFYRPCEGVLFASSEQRSSMRFRSHSGQDSFPQQRITCLKAPRAPTLRRSVLKQAFSTEVKIDFREWKTILVYSFVDHRSTFNTWISQHRVF